MFFGKKHQEVDNQIINEVDEILKSSDIQEVERRALMRVKTRLEKGEYLQRVLNDFIAEVRGLALKSKLSPDVGKFYSSIINDAFRGTGWSGMRFM